MMNTTRKNIFIVLGAILVIGASTHFAHGAFLDIFPGPGEFFSFIVAQFFNLLMTLASWLLSIAGFLLNVSITLTLRIKEFVDSAPGIYTTWKAIRDISGIFLIFFLLYAAIQMILGLESPGWGKLIRNIVMAGILINFSFFFAGLGIDLSNVVSMQLYNAIAPANSASAPSFGTSSSGVTSTMGDGGLANIFMNSLKIPTLFNSQKEASGVKETAMDLGRIAVVGMIGTIIIITSAFSFAAAALAFIARFVVLLFLLAFSPIWMLSIFPEVDKYVKMWKDAYKSMLIFMPIYLLLMYLGMNVLTTTPFFTAANTTVYKNWYDQFITIGINAALVIFLLNVPLFAAAAIAGKSGSVFDGILNGAAKRFGAGTVWKGIGSQAGARTAGRLAYSTNNGRIVKALTSFSPTVGGAVSSGLSSISKAGFGQKKGGYEDRLKDKKTSQEKAYRALGEVDKSKYKDKEDLEKAEARAKGYQARYIKNLPWRPSLLTLGTGGLIGFAVDNRANRQSQFKLSKDADKEGKKEAKKVAKKREGEISKRFSELTKEEQSLNEVSGIVLVGRDAENVRIRKEARLKEIADEKERLNNERTKIKEAIDAGTEVENEEKEKKVLDKLDEIDKKAGKGGESEPKTE